MLARTDSRARALFLLIVAALVAGGIGARLVWWQVVERDQPGDDGAPPARAGRGDPRRARRDHRRHRRPAGHLGRAPVGLRHAAVGRATRRAAPRCWRRCWAWRSTTLRERLARATRGSGCDGECDPAVSRAGRRPGPARHRHADRDRSGSTRSPAWRRDRPWPPRCSASSTPTASASTASRAAEDTLLAGLPGSVTAQEDVIGRQIADSIRQLQPAGGRRRTCS